MRILIDTNILISAALNGNGTPYRAYLKAVTFPNHAIVCDQNIDELRRIFNRKFPNKIPLLERFLSLALTVLEVVPTPVFAEDAEVLIRDSKDRPILRAAIDANVDILLTGDKDFLESGVKHPRMLTAAQFLELNEV
ncbi:putative toxin-antitoxin system toxin component, PIN family [Diplocloster hominis]|uniref:putative toxin-antitoxin system toxin component, PIN family n=1 Tax=Diplocloster hominis TaxID=3079010 RepID=UPI0031BACA3E